MGRKKSAPRAINLGTEQRDTLRQIAKGRSTPLQISKRAKILLLTEDGMPYVDTAKEVKVSLNTVKLWANRWEEHREEISVVQQNLGAKHTLLVFLNDKPRSGQPRKFSDAQVDKIVALACDKPSDYGLVMDKWTYETLVEVAIEKGIVSSISKTHLRLLLKNAPVTTA